MTDGLAGLIDRIAGARIMVIGDVMLDRFVYGDVERISPEAPIPVLKTTREVAMLGGAGNVVRNVASLGAQVHFCGLMGQDAPGYEIQSLLADLPGVTSWAISDSTRPTSIKTRFLAGTQQMLRTDREVSDPVGEEIETAVFKALEANLDDIDVLVLSDYGKGLLTPFLLSRLIDLARKADKQVIVDPKGSDYSKYRGASIVTPNRKELMEASKMSCNGDADIVAAANHVISICGIENVLATRSQDGMTLVCGTSQAHHLPTEAREVFDVSGAGDTVVAALSAGLSAGGSLRDAAALANVAAGIVVAKVGTATVFAEELLRAASQRDVAGASSAVLGLDAARDQVSNWRQRGFRVGFTNGCFDLLHPGHVSLLDQARAQCERLVVGLNSDASVQRLKGEERPVQTEDARATVLASLSSVDAVVIFEEDTPYELISALVPDVLVKGADYQVHEVVGADVVQANGGQVFLAELKDGFSTTNTVNKLRGS